MNKTKITIVVVVIALVAGVGLYLLLSLKTAGPVYESNGAPVTPAGVSAPAPAVAETLGSQIYLDSTNPVQNKVPALEPVTNPVKDAYKNPFQ